MIGSKPPIFTCATVTKRSLITNGGHNQITSPQDTHIDPLKPTQQTNYTTPRDSPPVIITARDPTVHIIIIQTSMCLLTCPFLEINLNNADWWPSSPVPPQEGHLSRWPWAPNRTGVRRWREQRGYRMVGAPRPPRFS